MKKVINGCIYAIDLGGTEEYEFKGVHPAMVVRMLKEEKMYYVVPLTTYTKERWEKCKRQGFGCRIVSTNSIARVDKINIVTEKQIHSRYYNSEKLVCAEPAEIEKVILSALLTGASSLGVKVKDTIKVVNDDETIKDTPDRSTLRAIQTPQVFDKDKYIKFLENAKNDAVDFTDDCKLFEYFGEKVTVVDGLYTNIKLTTQDDIILAESILKGRE